MAKIFGIQGYASGKLGAAVYAISGGQVVARQYNPSPNNPKSEKQVDARSSFKLLSQLSAVMAPVIAIPKRGNVSRRNRFTQINSQFVFKGDNGAEIDLEKVQITDSVVSLPFVTASRQGTSLNVALHAERNTKYIDAVVYVFFTREPDSTLRLTGSATVENPTPDEYGYVTWQAHHLMSSDAEHVVVYAYGMHFNTDGARASFGNMRVNENSIANLIATRLVLEGETTFTETRAVVSKPTNP